MSVRESTCRLSARLLVALVAAVAVAAVVPATARAASSEYYVERTVVGCSDSGAGIAAVPFCTVSAGLGVLRAGVTLYVGNGVYRETVRPAVSGSPGAR